VPLSESAAWKSLFTDTGARLASRRTVQLLGLGAIFAAAAFPHDNEVTRDLSTRDNLSGKARPGAVLGSTPFQVGGALMIYGLGAAFEKPRVQHVAGDLMRAQVLAEVMTVGIKHAVRRKRPDDSGSFSFPSGHTSVSFASATVLQRHFGWKFGVPAYGIAGYVALSRVQMQRHFLSDVAFGAAVGILAGRTVTVGHGRKLELAPVATPGGAAVSFRWIGREP
jgi:membrane-associated phospholipid phosphatase